jgi:hypothetical protein
MSKQKHKRRLKRIEELVLAYEEFRRINAIYSWRVSDIIERMLYMLDGESLDLDNGVVLNKSTHYLNYRVLSEDIDCINVTGFGCQNLRTRKGVMEIIRMIRRKVKKDLLSCA